MAIALSGCGKSTPPVAAKAASAAERGKEIYLHGISPSGGEILAEMGAGNLLPARSLPCASCHGSDGRGRPEGGVQPTNVRWDSLTRPYDVIEESGRRHPPYDEYRAGRAITMGIDAGGQRLNAVMPRFQMSRTDLDDLIAYLKQIGSETDPGIDGTQLSIGTFVDAEGPRAAATHAARDALIAYLDDFNRGRGLYGRRLVLRTVELPSEPAARGLAMASFIGQRPFALISTPGEGDEDLLLPLLSREGTPFIGAPPPLPRRQSPPNRYAFYLYAGLDAAGQVLGAFAAEKRPHASAIIVRSGDGEGGAMHEVAARIAATFKREGGGAISEIDLASKAAGEAPSLAGAGCVFLLGGAASPSLLAAAARSPSKPLVFLPGLPSSLALFSSASSASSAATLDGRLFSALPTSPRDRTPAFLSVYARLAAASHFSSKHLSAQLDTLAAAGVLVAALERAGRDVQRETLVDALEAVRDLPTGCTPPITFGRNQHIGTRRMLVVSITRGGVAVSPIAERNASD